MTVPEPLIALYGRTYWDAELEVDLASLGSGKGKRDVPVTTVVGGWACNAARAIHDRFPAGTVRVVTVTGWLDWPRLRAALPAGVVLDAILPPDAGTGMPPVTVIVNPSSACRLLRDPAQPGDALWAVDQVPYGATRARLHVLGRLPIPFVSHVLARSRAHGARTAWCGGDALPLELERELDLLCVNSAEAERLLGASGGSPRDYAEALARRARPAGAVRLVTGRDQAPAAGAERDGATVTCHLAAVAPVPKAHITRLKGAGDVFAAGFLAAACFDAHAAPEARIQVARGLEVAAEMTTRHITQGAR